jgi:hypothetical protein
MTHFGKQTFIMTQQEFNDFRQRADSVALKDLEGNVCQKLNFKWICQDINKKKLAESSLGEDIKMTGLKCVILNQPGMAGNEAIQNTDIEFKQATIDYWADLIGVDKATHPYGPVFLIVKGRRTFKITEIEELHYDDDSE